MKREERRGGYGREEKSRELKRANKNDDNS